MLYLKFCGKSRDLIRLVHYATNFDDEDTHQTNNTNLMFSGKIPLCESLASVLWLLNVFKYICIYILMNEHYIIFI